MESSTNIDARTVEGFGEEWSRFDQNELSEIERRRIFESYFAIFPWNRLPAHAVGADIGCGSGRWAQLVAPRVGRLALLDASDKALEVAKRALDGLKNVEFHHASVDSLPFADASLDFAYSLGVLHHVPDTAAAIAAISRKLKPGAPFLIYLYYALDDAPAYYRAIFGATNALRLIISRLPSRARFLFAESLAASVYLPLARTARLLDAVGFLPGFFPLAQYRDKSFYVMRTDALDRFGTRIEQRFTRAQIAGMMEHAGLSDIRFSDGEPYWVAVGYKLERT